MTDEFCSLTKSTVNVPGLVCALHISTHENPGILILSVLLTSTGKGSLYYMTSYSSP